MAQITWRNVGDPSFRGGNLARIAGTAALDRGINTLANLAGDINTENVQENTGAYLDQISQLDREGVAAAQAGGQFSREALEGQNVDKDSIIAALKGRTGEIDKKEDAAFNRAEMLRVRAEAPVIEQIRTLEAQGKFDEANILANESNIRDKSGLFKSITSSKREYDALQRSEDDRLQAEARNNVMQTMITDRQDTITNNQGIISQIESLGGSVNDNLELDLSSPEALQNMTDITKLATGLQRVDSETQHLRKIRKGLIATGSSVPEVAAASQAAQADFTAANQLSQGDQQALNASIAQAANQLDIQYDQAKRTHEELVKVTPRVIPLVGAPKAEAEASVIKLANQLAPSSSWLPDGDKTGGSYLREELTSLMSEEGVQPWMVEAALLTHTQTSDEAWGNPVADIEAIKDQVKAFKEDPTGKSLKTSLDKSRELLDLQELQLPLNKSKEASRLTRQAKIKARIPYRKHTK